VPPADGAPTRVVVADASALADAAFARVCEAGARATAGGGRFSLVLSGGSTPRALHARLAAAPDALPWDRVDVWFGDERCVPPDDAASNYGMARDTLLSRVPIPPANVRRIEGERGAAAAADAYDALLRAAYGDPGDAPTFDLVLLGIGTEGHTASLFPGHAALGIRDRWAAPVDPAPPTAKPLVPRATLTLPALCGAREVLFLVAGADKAPIVRAVLGGDGALPAALARGRERTTWLVDEAAGR